MTAANPARKNLSVTVRKGRAEKQPEVIYEPTKLPDIGSLEIGDRHTEQFCRQEVDVDLREFEIHLGHGEK